jgi:transcriptional regulator with XRE-family HTH domain
MTASPGRRRRPIGDVDRHVAARFKLRRQLLGMTQETLGAAIGLTFQQVQKYERGSNRISAGTLYRIAQALDVPAAFLFDGLGDGAAPVGGEAPEALSRADVRLLRLARTVPDEVAEHVARLLAAAAGEDGEEADGARRAGP